MTGTTGHYLAAGLCLLAMFACHVGAAEPVKVELRFEPGQKALTPSGALGHEKVMAIQGSSGQIDLGFGPLPVKVTAAGRSYCIGVDVDGDGKISKQEQAMVGKGDVAALAFARPGENGGKSIQRILFTDVRVGTSQGAIKVVQARCHADYSLRGIVGKTPIYLIDDNLDGKFTQDGKDAIVVGSSSTGLPLLKTVTVEGKEYDLEVAADGKSLTCTPVENKERGKVALPFRSAGLRCLVLRTDTYACDVSGNGATVPVGDYKLAYGLLAVGAETVVILPAQNSPLYAIRGDTLNTIQVGPPLTVLFEASVQGDKMMVSPNLRVVGASGERYALDFKGIDRPKVCLAAGKRLISSDAMGYG